MVCRTILNLIFKILEIVDFGLVYDQLIPENVKNELSNLVHVYLSVSRTSCWKFWYLLLLVLADFLTAGVIGI